MHSTSQARLALVWLLCLLGTVVLARMGEAQLRTRPRPPPNKRALPVAHGPRPEGDALRDGRRIDPNFASALELQLLPGVGPRVAADIVARRARSGPFHTLGELRQVRGIGERTLAKMEPFLRIDSERLEHPTQTQRDIAGIEQVPALDHERAAQIQTGDPAPRQQVVHAEHEVRAGP